MTEPLAVTTAETASAGAADALRVLVLLRAADDDEGVDEVHLIEFDEEAGLERYRDDPRGTALAGLGARAIGRTLVYVERERVVYRVIVARRMRPARARRGSRRSGRRRSACRASGSLPSARPDPLRPRAVARRSGA